MITRLLDGTATVPVIVRMPGIHGLPRTSGLVHNVISAALADAPIEIQEPDSRLSILMLHHAAAALAGMATAGIHSGARILNLATGSMDLGRLARLVVELTGSSSIIRLGSKAARIRALDCSLAERLPANAAYGIEQALADEIALHRAR
jgi:nucleoside-diphosphate-sugar epimerase